LIPITDAMKAGKEPLRTFGDLLQFYQTKTVAPSDGQPPAVVPEPPVKDEVPATTSETPATVEQASASQDNPSV